MDTVAEFRSRAALTWRRTRIWIWLCIPAVGGLIWSWHPPRAIFLACFAYLALAIIVCTFTVRRHYRCPECEAVVTDADGGIPLFPKACRKCGARLR